MVDWQKKKKTFLNAKENLSRISSELLQNEKILQPWHEGENCMENEMQGNTFCLCIVETDL